MDEVSASEACQILKCSKTWLIKLIKRGTIKGRKVGNIYVIDRQSVLDYQARE